MRLKLTLAYDGSAYQGWQIQEKANPPPTVQGAAEAALFALTGEKIRVFGAGRTDSGVHATGQIAHCDVPQKDWDWRLRLNSVLPADIRIVAASETAPEFHARKDALSKTYIYQFWRERAFTPPFLRGQVWPVGDLDMNEIVSGLGSLLGEHDFASFQNAGTPVKSTIRKITAIELRKFQCEAFGGCLPPLRLAVTGSGFLKQMVRNIAGFLAAIGKGKLAWSDFEKIMKARDRRALKAPTAPPQGLFLARVDYRENE